MRYNKLFECAEDGKQYVIVAGSTTAKPNLVILGADSGSAVVESNDIPKFNGFIKSVPSIIGAVAPTYEDIYFSEGDYTFVAKLGTDYYASWDTSHLYKDGPGVIESRLFEYNKQLYMYDGKSLNLLNNTPKIEGYTFVGTATPSTMPIAITEDSKVFYIASEEGDYSNFGLGNINSYSILKSSGGKWAVDNLNIPFFELESFLPIEGGKMSGDIDMDGKRVDNIGIEEVSSLPTTNLYEGRMVKFKNKTYTFYNGLWLALSDDLRGRVNDTHEENFVYQPTASDLSIKDGFADIKKLKGNTIVWNQLCNGFTDSNANDNGNFENIVNSPNMVWGKINGVSGDGKGVINLSHKYLFKGFINFSQIGNINKSYIYGCSTYQAVGNPHTLPQPVYFSQIITRTYDRTGLIMCKDEGNKNATGWEAEYNMQFFDLTQMFGEGNEPATVEEFEAMFPNDYYEYNEGELMSFDGKGLKSVGFNLFDKTKVESESYLYHTNGISTYHKGLKESVSDFIRVIPSTKYYVKNIISNNHRTTWVYDSNKMPLTTISASTTDNIDGKYLASREITIPDNAHYIRFGIYDEYLDSACINLSHSGYRDGEYQPYEDYTLSFQDGKTISQLTGKLNGEGESVTIFPDGLRSAGTVFDEITPDGKAVKRIGSVDMGALNWTYNDGSSNSDNYPYGYFINHLTTRKPGIKTIICTKYPEHNNSFNKDKVIVPATLQSSIYIVDSSYTDADSLKASLQGQILYYELETPEVYELDFPINTSYEAYDFGTEEVLYNDENAVNIPMKADIEYGFNAVDMIRNNFEEIRSLKERVTALEQAILQIQAANTAAETPIEP